MVCNEFKHLRIALPSIYADSLSYYEAIMQLCKAVDDSIELISQYEQNYKDYTDQEIAKIDAKVTEQLAETITTLNANNEEFQRLVNNNIVLFDSRLNNLNEKIDASVVGVNDRIDLAIEQNNDYLFNELSKGLLDLKVINFFTGDRITVQAMFDYLASFHLSEGISYTGLANKNKTYNELIALNITYTTLVTSGGIIIE